MTLPNPRPLLLLSVVGFACLLPPCAAEEKEEESLRLRYRLKKGDSAQYRIRYAALASASMPSMPGMDSESAMIVRGRGELKVRQSVARISENGDLHIQTQVLEGRETMYEGDEEHVEKLRPAKQMTRVDPRGVLLEALSGPSDAQNDDRGPLGGMSAADFFQGANVIPFPKEPAKRGDEWEDDMEVALDKGDTMQVKTSSKLVAWVTCLGKQCAKIKTSYQAIQEFSDDAEGMTMNATVSVVGNLTGYYAVADGLLVYSEDSVTAVIRTEMGGLEEAMGAAAERLGQAMAEMDMTATVRIRANAKTVLKQ